MNPPAAPAPAPDAARPPGVLLRRLQPEDAPAYRALMLSAYRLHPDAFTSSVAEREPLPLSWWVSRLGTPEARTEQVIGAFVGPVLAGAAGLSVEPRERLRHKATLFGMSVAPGYRRLGLGRALVQAVLAAARAQSALRVLQLTVSEHNDAAIALYEEAGFQSFGTEPLAVLLGDACLSKRHMAVDLHPPCDTLHLVDSEVSQVSAWAEGLCLHFSAASVWRERPGQAPVSGHLQGLALKLLGPLPPLQLAEWHGRLAAGRLRHEAHWLSQMALPCQLQGRIDVELRFAQGAGLQMQATSLQALVPLGAVFTESMAC